MNIHHSLLEAVSEFATCVFGSRTATRIGPLVLAIICLTISGCQPTRDIKGEYPNRPIKVVVPFGAGGGTDNYARIFKQAIDEQGLLPQPLVVINQGGAGATIGSRRVKEAPPDGYTVLLLHDAILTAKLAGTVDYGPEAFEAIAGTGEVGMVITVAEDSPYRDLNDLLDAAQRQPNRIAFGANLGALTHFAGLQLEQLRDGAEFRYAQIGGGADRFANLKAGHIDVTGFSIEEFVRFRTDGLRGLAYFGETRHEAALDIPTAREQGYDLLSRNTFYWWFPKGTPQPHVEYLAGVLEQAMQTEFVQTQMEQIHCKPVLIRGPSLERRLEDSWRRLSRVNSQKTVTLPRLPGVLGVTALLLGAASCCEILVRRLRHPGGQASKEVSEIRTGSKRTDLALLVFVGLVAYVLALAATSRYPAMARFVDFRLATICFVLFAGGVLAGRHSRRLALVAVLAFAVGLGTHFVFTHLFVVDLP